MVIGREFKLVIAIETQFIAYALITRGKEGAALLRWYHSCASRKGGLYDPMAKCNPSTWRKKRGNKEADIWMPGIGMIGHRLRDPSPGKLPFLVSLWCRKNDWISILGLIRWRSVEEILSIFATCSYDEARIYF